MTLSIFTKDRHEALNFTGKPSRRSVFTRVADVTISEPVDRGTFNYGRALGVPKASDNPWNASDPGLRYKHARDYASALGSIATQFSDAAWKLEMKLRDVRNACTPAEQTQALSELDVAFHAVDRLTEQVTFGPLKFYRYGRIGNVLRHFTPKL